MVVSIVDLVRRGSLRSELTSTLIDEVSLQTTLTVGRWQTHRTSPFHLHANNQSLQYFPS